jgi:hypothetical protein
MECATVKWEVIHLVLMSQTQAPSRLPRAVPLVGSGVGTSPLQPNGGENFGCSHERIHNEDRPTHCIEKRQSHVLVNQ